MLNLDNKIWRVMPTLYLFYFIIFAWCKIPWLFENKIWIELIESINRDIIVREKTEMGVSNLGVSAQIWAVDPNLNTVRVGDRSFNVDNKNVFTCYDWSGTRTRSCRVTRILVKPSIFGVLRGDDLHQRADEDGNTILKLPPTKNNNRFQRDEFSHGGKQTPINHHLD